MIDNKSIAPKFMTLREVAEYLRVTEKTIHRLLDRNAIPATRVGHLWRFEKDSLDKWLEDRTTAVQKPHTVIDDEEHIRALIRKPSRSWDGSDRNRSGTEAWA
jgi:excisionase family DNA binding protein